MELFDDGYQKNRKRIAAAERHCHSQKRNSDDDPGIIALARKASGRFYFLDRHNKTHRYFRNPADRESMFGPFLS
jgi:hypothetical protein